MIRKPMGGNRTILVKNLQYLERFAEFLSKNLSSGDFVALTGALGAGKTTFTRLLCQAFGLSQAITSPTFTLVNEYRANGLLILHGDLYRLDDREVEAMLEELEDRFDREASLVLMEWADKAPQLQYRWTWHLDFAFAPEDESVRLVMIETTMPEKLSALMEALSDEF